MSINILTQLYCFLGMLFFFFGCAHQPKMLQRNITFKDFIREQIEKTKTLDHLLIDLHMQLDSPRQKIGGDGEWLTDSVRGDRLEMTDFLGRLHYLLIQTPQEFQAYYPDQKIAYKDTASGKAYFEELLDVSQTFPEIRRKALGVWSESQLRNIKPWQVSEDEYVLHSGNSTIIVARQAGLIKEVIEKTSNGNIYIKYSNYEKVSVQGLKIWLAKKVTMGFEKSKIEIEFAKIEKAKASARSYHFDYPKNTQWIRLH